MILIHCSKFVRKLKFAFDLAGGLPHRILDQGIRLVVSGTAKELFDRHVDFPDVFVAEEVPLVPELKDEIQPVRLSCRFINGEPHGVIPRGTGPAILVDRCFLLRARVARDCGDYVDVHLGEGAHIFEIFGRDYCYLQWSTLHFNSMVSSDSGDGSNYS